MTDPLIDQEAEDVQAESPEGRESGTVDGAVRSESAHGEADAEFSPKTPNTPESRGMSEASGAEMGEDSSASSADSDQGPLQEKFDALNDRHLRLVAEFNNFRRRTEQERLSAWSRAQADLVGNFLDVLDDLQRVAELDLSNATVEAIMEGIDLVERKFVRALGDSGAEAMDPTGQKFDPEQMEAMMRVPVEPEDQVDTVAQVFQKGYSLKGILVRPARVSVFTQG